MIKITFPDGTVREYEQGVTGLQIAESISPALARNVVSCGVNGETVELNRPILSDATIALYKFEDEEGKHSFWHTSAHLLAEALKDYYHYVLGLECHAVIGLMDWGEILCRLGIAHVVGYYHGFLA